MSTIVIKNPKVKIQPDLLSELQECTHEKGQVVLHFLFKVSGTTDSLMRIWPTTYLYDNHSSHRSDLVHVENITLYPQWSQCPAGSRNYFTLIFSGLPDHCISFDFIEHCSNEAGAFQVKNVLRNDNDIYYIEIS